MSFMASLVTRSATSPENPQFDLNDPAAWDALAAPPSSSGVRVNAHTALKYAAVWRAVNLISFYVAKLPIMVYERTGESEDSGRRRARDHPIFSLLRHKPNEEMNAFIFVQTLQGHVLQHGNAYAYIFRRNDGRIRELIPLIPGIDSTFPVRENGRLWYVTTVRGQMRKLRPENVLHLKGLGYDGLVGYDPITYNRDSLGLGLATERYSSRFFRNDARAGVVLQHPGKLKPETAKRLRESWERMHQGLDNAHRVAVLEEGMEAKEMTVAARNAQLIESRQFEIRNVANWYGVPPHKLGDTTRTSFSSLEQENQSFLDDGLDPWLTMWEAELYDKLLTEREKAEDSIIIEFMRQALVRADLNTRGAFYRQSLGGRPWMTLNEVRSRENLNPVDGGDVILEPLNMVDPTDDTPEPPEDPPEPSELPENPPSGDDDDDDAAGRSETIGNLHRRILTETAGRMVRRVTKQVRRRAQHPKTFEQRVTAQAIAHDHGQTIAEALDAPARACSIDLAGDESRTDLIVRRIAGSIGRIVTERSAALCQAVPASEFRAAIETAMDAIDDESVDAIVAEALDEPKQE